MRSFIIFTFLLLATALVAAEDCLAEFNNDMNQAFFNFETAEEGCGHHYRCLWENQQMHNINITNAISEYNHCCSNGGSGC